MSKLVIFDWIGTLYDSESSELYPDSSQTLRELRERDYDIALISKRDNPENGYKEVEKSGI